MREKRKKSFLDKIRDKVKKSPTYAKLLRKRDKLADLILAALLTFFDAVSPVWTFLFVKTSDEIDHDNRKDDTRTEIVSRYKGLRDISSNGFLGT